MIKISKAVVFVRKHGLLKSWSYMQIGHGIKLAIDKAALTFTTDDKGNLSSIVWGEWKDKGETFHVVCAAGKGHLKILLAYLRNVFPQCKKITAHRSGKFTTYNV